MSSKSRVRFSFLKENTLWRYSRDVGWWIASLCLLRRNSISRSYVGVLPGPPKLANPFEYRQLVEALMFLVNSHPDICFVVNTWSQFMVEPHHIQWIVAKNLLRYLRGTINYGLGYTVRNLRLHGYTDVDWVGSVVERKSVSGCCFSLGSASISWMSRKKKSVDLSTAEAEYIVARMACCDVVWLRKLFSELFEHMLDTIMIFCNNQSGIPFQRILCSTTTPSTLISGTTLSEIWYNEGK